MGIYIGVPYLGKLSNALAGKSILFVPYRLGSRSGDCRLRGLTAHHYTRSSETRPPSATHRDYRIPGRSLSRTLWGMLLKSAVCQLAYGTQQGKQPLLVATHMWVSVLESVGQENSGNEVKQSFPKPTMT